MNKRIKSSQLKFVAHTVFPAMVLCLLASTSMVSAMQEPTKDNIENVRYTNKLKKYIGYIIEKIEITPENIKRPLNLSYLTSLKNDEEVNFENLFNLEGTYSKNWTNLVHLAICSGNWEALEKFLEVVDVNSRDLYVSGYRQSYTLAHTALNPQFPSVKGIPLKDRLKCIDILAKKGANFNSIPNESIYKDPPLGSDDGHLYKLIGHDDKHALKAYAILLGADPEKEGSSFNGLRYYAHIRLNVEKWNKENKWEYDPIPLTQQNKIIHHSDVYDMALKYLITKELTASKATDYVKFILTTLFEKHLKAIFNTYEEPWDAGEKETLYSKVLLKQLKAFGLKD